MNYTDDTLRDAIEVVQHALKNRRIVSTECHGNYAMILGPDFEYEVVPSKVRGYVVVNRATGYVPFGRFYKTYDDALHEMNGINSSYPPGSYFIVSVEEA